MASDAAKAPTEDGAAVKPIGRPSLLILPGVVWLLLFGVAPLVFMVVMSFWTSTIFGTKPDFSFANYVRLTADPLYGKLILKTFRIGISATLISLVISYPMAYFLSRQKGIWKAVFVLMMFLPFLDELRRSNLRLAAHTRSQRRHQSGAAVARHHRRAR